MKYTIYTDGACSGNPGPGGWGAVIFDNENKQKNISGREENTTNNRMELSAAIMALQEVNTNSEITIYTDSTYVKNGITEWVLKWKENEWKNSNKEPVKNKDLWEKLDTLCEQNIVNWKWVKAHASNKYNNLPGYVNSYDQAKKKGVTKIICVSVNDANVMKAWGDNQNVGDKIFMAADPYCEFTKSIGAEIDRTDKGLGMRSSRYTMLIENNVIKSIKAEEDTAACEISAAENFIKEI